MILDNSITNLVLRTLEIAKKVKKALRKQLKINYESAFFILKLFNVVRFARLWKSLFKYLAIKTSSGQFYLLLYSCFLASFLEERTSLEKKEKK